MSDNKASDPRLSDRNKAADPRLNAVRPLPPEKYATNRPRSREHSLERPPRGGADRRGSDRGNDEEGAVPPPSRYSPPPSLKPYTIPRRAGQKPLLMATSLDSREGTLAIETVKNSLWNPETVTFEFTKVEMVNNDRLEAEYVTKRKELKEAGRTASELSDHFVFSHMRNKEECRDICQRGIYCKSQHHLPSKAACSLGDKKYGVYLCRCADAITKKIPTQQFGKESIMLICKVMKGRVKTINDQADQSNPDLEPTPDFDSHISRRFQRGKKMPSDHIYDSSQIYLYEVDLDNISADDEDAIFAKRPRQVLPFAIVHFKIKQNLQPAAEPKVPLKDPTMMGAKVTTSVVGGQPNLEPDGPDVSYEECLKNLRYFWQGFCFMKTRFLAPVRIGLFTRKEVFFPMETPNISIQQKISWKRLGKILPGKIYRKPPCRLLQPETEVVGIKFIHGEIHGADKATEEVVNTLYTTWLNSSMAGVCTLSTGYKLYIIPSSLFTDTLGLSDPSYPPILHCLFMKETIVPPRPSKEVPPPYDKFILRQQISLNSRICENDELKETINIDIINRPAPPQQQQQMMTYSLNERQTVAKCLGSIRRYQEKRGIVGTPMPPNVPAAAIRSQIAPHMQHAQMVAAPFQPQANIVRGVIPPNIAIPINPMNPMMNPQNVMIQNFAPNSLLATVPIGMANPVVPPPMQQGAAQTLVSPISSGGDSFSSNEGQGADEQAIDFCLSFKRDGSSGKTERVKLFPEEKNAGGMPAAPAVPPNEVRPLTPPPPPPEPMEEIPHIPPPLFAQPTPPPLYGEPVPLPLYSEPAPPTPPPATYCESPPPPPPPPRIPTVQEVEALYAPTPSNVVDEDDDNVNSDALLITDTDTDVERTTTTTTIVVKKNVKKNVAIMINTAGSDSDSEDNLVINLDDETENEHVTNNDNKESDVEKCDMVTDQTTAESEEDSPTSPVHSSTPAKSKSDDVFIKSSQNLLSQLSSFLPKSLSKKSHKKSSKLKSSQSKNLHSKYSSREESGEEDTPAQMIEKFEEETTSTDNKPCMEEGDNYDTLTMDESSQEAIVIEEEESDHDTMDMDCDTTLSSTGGENAGKRPAKCSSPSLTQLTFTKEKILQQLSLLKAQTEEKRKADAIKKALKEEEAEEEIHEEGEIESGAESQESEVIPFLGGEEDEYQDGVESDVEEGEKHDVLVVASSFPQSTTTTTAIVSPSYARVYPPLDAEKAERALFNIGTEYYDQVPSPVATTTAAYLSARSSEQPTTAEPLTTAIATSSTSSSTATASSPPASAADRARTPPLTHSPDRPVGKVSPVSTTTSFPSSARSSAEQSSIIIDIFSSTTAATTAVTISTSSSSPRNSAMATSTARSDISFFSNDPRNKVPSATTASVKPAFVPAFASGANQSSSGKTTPSSVVSGGQVAGDRQRLKINLPTVSSSSSSSSSSAQPPTSERVTVSERPTTLNTTTRISTSHVGPIRDQKTSMPASSGAETSSSSPLQRAPPLMSVETSNPPKRPIMEVSPVVRSTQAPWVNPANRPEPPLTTRKFGNPAFRPNGRQNEGRSPVGSTSRNITYPVKGTYGVNREQADAMYHNREGGPPGPNHDASNRLNQPRVPRAYRPGSRTPDDESSSSARSYRGRSPSPNSSDWDSRSSSSSSRYHRDRRRPPRSRSRSRSPNYSRSRSSTYHRSRSPKRSRDRSPRQYRDRDRNRDQRGSGSDWEKQDFREIYGSDIEVYQDDKPSGGSERESRRGERGPPRGEAPPGERSRRPPRFDSPSYRPSPSPPPPSHGPPPRDGPPHRDLPPGALRMRYNDNSYSPASPSPPRDIPSRDMPPRGHFPNEHAPPRHQMGEDEIDSRGGSRQQHRPPLGRSLIGRGLDRGWLHPRIPNQPSFRPQDHPMFNRNNAEGPPPPAGHRQRSIRESHSVVGSHPIPSNHTNNFATNRFRAYMTLNDPIRSLEEPTPYVIEQNYRFQHPLHDSNNRPLFSRRNNDCETENGGWSSGRSCENTSEEIAGTNRWRTASKGNDASQTNPYPRSGSKTTGFKDNNSTSTANNNTTATTNNNKNNNNNNNNNNNIIFEDISSSEGENSRENVENKDPKLLKRLKRKGRRRINRRKKKKLKQASHCNNEGFWQDIEVPLGSEFHIFGATTAAAGDVSNKDNDLRILRDETANKLKELTESTNILHEKLNRETDNLVNDENVAFQIETDNLNGTSNKLKELKQEEVRYVTFESVKNEFLDFQKELEKSTATDLDENVEHDLNEEVTTGDRFSDFLTKKISISPTYEGLNLKEKVSEGPNTSVNNENVAFEIETNVLDTSKLTKEEVRYVTFESVQNEFLDFEKELKKSASNLMEIVTPDTSKTETNVLVKDANVAFEIETNNLNETANKFRINNLKEEVRFVTFESVQNEFLNFQKELKKKSTTNELNGKEKQHFCKGITNDKDKFSELLTKEISIGPENEKVSDLYEIPTAESYGKINEDIKFIRLLNVNPYLKEREATRDKFRDLLTKKISISPERELVGELTESKTNKIRTAYNYSDISEELNESLTKGFDEQETRKSNQVTVDGSDEHNNSPLMASLSDSNITTSQTTCNYSDISEDENGWSEWLETPFEDGGEDEGMDENGVGTGKDEFTIINSTYKKMSEPDNPHPRSVGHFLPLCERE